MTGLYAERLPPHDADAEEGILGSLLIAGADVMAEVVGVVKPADFYRASARLVFEACVELYKDGAPIDTKTVANVLNRHTYEETVNGERVRRTRLQDVGGLAYLKFTWENTPTPTHAAFYARTVAECAVKRRLIEAAGEIAAYGYDEAIPARDAVEKAGEMVSGLQPETDDGIRHVKEVGDDFLAEQSVSLDEALMRKPVVMTGFADLDRWLGGLRAGTLYVIAARPSVGKSALVTNIARNVASNGQTVALFSLEMSDGEVFHRLLSQTAEVDTHLLRLGLLSLNDQQRVDFAVGEISDMPLWIDDKLDHTVMTLRAQCQRVPDVGLVIVDYLQLMERSGRGRGNRVDDVSEITRGLKALSKEFEVPVIALSQLSRQIEQRPDHYPQLSDLRESGSIEQDADVVVFIHREDVYFTPEQWAMRHGTEAYPENVTELVIAKNRHGPKGSVHVWARMQWSRFETLVSEPVPEQVRMPYVDA